MLKTIINRLKNKKKQLRELNDKLDNKESLANIIITNENDIFKIEVSDYISLEYLKENLKLNGRIDLLNILSDNVLWNVNRQCANKGTYYVISNNKHIYNILLNDELLVIEQKNNDKKIIEEELITINTFNNKYSYCNFKHSHDGEILDTKYYNNDGFSLGTLDLSDEDAQEKMSLILSNLENIDIINKILNINLIKNYIINNNDNKKVLIK